MIIAYCDRCGEYKYPKLARLSQPITGFLIIPNYHWLYSLGKQYCSKKCLEGKRK